MTVSYEEATRCPRCSEPGEVTGKHKPGPRADFDHRSARIHTVVCRNEGCRWYNTGWVVQVNEDGSIYEREHGPRGHDKDFPHITEDQKARSRRWVEDNGNV